MDDTSLLDQVRIAKPCPANWNEMAGDERARFCAHCQKHVYNLSAMSTVEATALIREKEGKLCARIYRRRDGTILTADCPVGLRRMRERCIAGVTAAIALVLGAIGLGGCLKRADVETGKSFPPGYSVAAGAMVVATPATNVTESPLMGDMESPKMGRMVCPTTTNQPSAKE